LLAFSSGPLHHHGGRCGTAPEWPACSTPPSPASRARLRTFVGRRRLGSMDVQPPPPSSRPLLLLPHSNDGVMSLAQYDAMGAARRHVPLTVAIGIVGAGIRADLALSGCPDHLHINNAKRCKIALLQCHGILC
jgi:hypothetical protein